MARLEIAMSTKEIYIGRTMSAAALTGVMITED